MSKSKRDIVIQYRSEIDLLTNRVRQWLGGLDSEPTNEEIKAYTENVLFENNNLQGLDTSEITTIIESSYMRASSKYGILSTLLEDTDINEIMVNGPEYIYVEKNHRIVPVDDAFVSEAELEEVIRMFATDVHREINEANPIVDARLKNGYRVNGVLKNVALNGPILTIRKFSDKEIGLNDLIKYGSLSRECAQDLIYLVRSGYNIFISGGTSSGKTTFLNALATAINPDERAIIIEDSAELKIKNLKNKVHMECRSANSVGKGEVTMQQLIKTSLRMRPDRIIVGEVRGSEVVDMIQAMNTGHEGSMSTGHGNSIKGMLNRLETMYLMDSQIPMFSVKSQISNAIDIFVHLRRNSNGKRGVVEVAELYGYDGNEYKINYLYKANQEGKLERTDIPLVDRERLVRAGLGDKIGGKNDDKSKQIQFK